MPLKDPIARAEYDRGRSARGTERYRTGFERLSRWKRDKERLKAHARAYTRRFRERMLVEYGHLCACCGETRSEFLTVDHVNGDGAADRRKRNLRGWRLYKRMRDEGFPKHRYRLLCWNCNGALGVFKFCPHLVEPEYGVGVAC